MRCSCRLISGLLSLSLLAGVASATTGSADSYLRYSGTATNLHAQNFLYRENHVLHYRDGRIAERVVLYTCRDGSPFARKTVSYVNTLSPDFLLEDASNGMREGVRTAGQSREVFFRGDRVDREKTGAVPQVSGLVADSGFDEFVRANWQTLMAGDALRMRFLVPSRLDDMVFQVRHVRSDRIDDTAVEIFRLKLSGVLGWVLPGIDVYYGASDHVLMRYVGLSDLRDASKDNFQAQITFPPSGRQAGDEADVASARQARLAPCK